MASDEKIAEVYGKRDDMVIVDGVRYRAKDAAKLKKDDDSKSRTAANKSRTAENK